MTALFESVLKFLPAQPLRPLGRPLTARDLPDALILRAASAAQREALLVGLALSKLEVPADVEGAHAQASLLEGMKRVLLEANALALRQVLEVMARRGSLGFVVEALGLEWLLSLGASQGIAISDVLASSDTVSRRGLTQSESRRIVENFGGMLDPETIRLCFTTGIQTMGAGAMVLGNTIHVDPSDPRWNLRPGTTLPESGDDESWDSYNAVLLAHEATHVWSYQHQGSRYAVNSVMDQLAALRSGTRAAAYRYTPNRPHVLEFGEEQRAMLVQDFVVAQRGQSRGISSTPTLYGGLRPVDEVVKMLIPYVRQLLALGPGVAQPDAGTAAPLLCACARAFEQDGVAGFLGSQGTELLAAAGRASTAAVVSGLAAHAPGVVAAGLGGVSAAVVASLLPREQNADGASGGGSAILDQARVPHGVTLAKGGAVAGVELAWDAPTQGPLGMGDPRVEVEARVRHEFGQAQLDAEGSATVGLQGDVRQASATARVTQGESSLEVAGGMTAERGATPLRAWARVELVTVPVVAHLAGSASLRDGVLQTIAGEGAIEGRSGLARVEAHASRAHADAPLALDEAKVLLHGNLGPHVTAGLGATWVARGLDEVSGSLAAASDVGTLGVTASGTRLTTTPTIGVSVNATEKKSGVTVAANARSTPSTGEVEAGVTVSVPLPSAPART